MKDKNDRHNVMVDGEVHRLLADQREFGESRNATLRRLLGLPPPRTLARVGRPRTWAPPVRLSPKGE